MAFYLSGSKDEDSHISLKNLRSRLITRSGLFSSLILFSSFFSSRDRDSSFIECVLCYDCFIPTASKEEGSSVLISFEVPLVSLGPSSPGYTSNSMLCVSINDALADVTGRLSILSFRL